MGTTIGMATPTVPPVRLRTAPALSSTWGSPSTVRLRFRTSQSRLHSKAAFDGQLRSPLRYLVPDRAQGPPTDG